MDAATLIWIMTLEDGRKKEVRQEFRTVEACEVERAHIQERAAIWKEKHPGAREISECLPHYRVAPYLDGN